MSDLVPPFFHFFRPILEVLSDGKTWQRRDLKRAAMDRLGLSKEAREVMLASGKWPMADHRAGWAISYLRQAELLENPSRGSWRISSRGQDYLRSAPNLISVKDLEQFEGIQRFMERSRKVVSGGGGGATPVEPETPIERIESAYRDARETLITELLAKVKEMHPKRFEQLVLEVMEAMGYGEEYKHTGRPRDKGIDGIIHLDKLGLEQVCLQAKRFTSGPVGPSDITSFSGAIRRHKAHRGVFFTCSTFTEDAKAAASEIGGIVLVDGHRLAELMIDHGIGVVSRASFTIKDVDEGFFEED